MRRFGVNMAGGWEDVLDIVACLFELHKEMNNLVFVRFDCHRICAI